LYNFTDETTNYQWYSPGSKSYLANATVDSMGVMTSLGYQVPYVPVHLNAGLRSITPDTLTQGVGSVVTIVTYNTHFTEGTTPYVSLATSTDSIVVINDTVLTARVRFGFNDLPGYKYLFLTSSADDFWEDSAVYLLPSPVAPKLLRVSPGFGIQGTTTDLVIHGINTHFAGTTSLVYLYPASGAVGTAWLSLINVVDDSTLQVRANSSPDAAGTFNLQVSNQVDGSLTLANSLSFTVTGIAENADAEDMIVFPNPASDLLNIRVQGIIQSVTLSDATGRVLITKVDPGSFIEINQLNNGMYFLTVTTHQGTLNKRISISR
jgi:hypothetical protein